LFNFYIKWVVKKKQIGLSLLLIVLVVGAMVFISRSKAENRKEMVSSITSQADYSARANHQGKAVIYQVLPRLFGNQKIKNMPWGTSKENGVGKFSDFTETALKAIKQ